MALSITKLRADLYNIIDHVIATGTAIEIERNGHIVKIIPEKPKKKLDNLIKHPGTMKGNPEDFVHIDWSDQWDEKNNL